MEHVISGFSFFHPRSCQKKKKKKECEEHVGERAMCLPCAIYVPHVKHSHIPHTAVLVFCFSTPSLSQMIHAFFRVFNIVAIIFTSSQHERIHGHFFKGAEGTSCGVQIRKPSFSWVFDFRICRWTLSPYPHNHRNQWKGTFLATEYLPKPEKGLKESHQVFSI